VIQSYSQNRSGMVSISSLILQAGSGVVHIEIDCRKRLWYVIQTGTLFVKEGEVVTRVVDKIHGKTF